MTRVLAVEDSPTQAAELAIILDEEGFEAEIAASGEEGLELLRGGACDLVLLDVLLPGKTGFEICRDIRSDPALRDLPVVLITTLDRPEDVLRGLECGANGYICKPYEPEALVEQLRLTLQRRERLLNGESWVETSSGHRLPFSPETAEVVSYLMPLIEQLLDRTRRAQAPELAEALRRSEERLALATAGTRDGLWDYDVQRDELFLSPRWAEIVGESTEELPPELPTWWERVHPDDRERFAAEIHAHMTGELASISNEHRLRHRNGAYVWVLCRGRSIRDAAGRPYRVSGSITDITMQKDLEEKLLHASGELHAILQALPDLYLQLDVDGTIRDGHTGTSASVNEFFTKTRGRSLAEVLPSPVAREWQEAITSLRDTGAPAKIDSMLKDDVHVEARFVPLGEDEVIGVIRDRTAGDRTWRALRSREQQLDALLKCFPGVIYRGVLDHVRTMLDVGDAARESLGFESTALLDGSRPYGEAIHPADRDRVQETIRERIESGRPYDLTYRIRDASGRERRIWERGRGERGSGGAIELHGFLVDVTDREGVAS